MPEYRVMYTLRRAGEETRSSEVVQARGNIAARALVEQAHPGARATGVTVIRGSVGQ